MSLIDFLSRLRRRKSDEKTATANTVPSLNPLLPAPPPYKHVIDVKAIFRHENEEDFLSALPTSIKDQALPSYDPGVLNNELLNLKIFHKIDPKDPSKSHHAGGNITKGTYAGTQVAITQLYERIEQSYSTYFDVLAVESTLPRYISPEEKKQSYKFTSYPMNEDGTPAQYPPSLNHIPAKDEVALWKIFNVLGLAESLVLLQKVIPDEFLGKTRDWIQSKEREVVAGSPQTGLTIEDVVEYNKHHRKSAVDIARGENLGMLDDWYSDRRFADQRFTGCNPTTITNISDKLLEEFIDAAKAAGEAKWVINLSKAGKKSLFVQDCSYFREAIGLKDPAGEMRYKQAWSDDNWACASVSLFQLHDDGKLHPVAICIDYKESMAKSVTVFNKRYLPTDSTDGEKNDWPWRYAKTCAQVSDWLVHELAVHLTHAHLVEEPLIVATNRMIPMDHIIYRILSPHWYKTLSLNAAARTSLVPQIIADIIGFSPEQSSSFLRHAYDNFDFVGNYVPNDLKSRGFPSTEEGLKNPRYKNYAYAKNMAGLWVSLRTYVKSMLELYYDKNDPDAVARDEYVKNWIEDIHTQAHIKTFPVIKTLDDLTDAITMCIHIAAPFHTAVNYLQNFYQSFVAARPPMLCSPLPTTLTQLKTFREPELVASLPMNRQREWLLAAHVPWLLSFKVESDRSLMNFALSQWKVYQKKEEEQEKQVRDISEMFYLDLCKLAKTFYYNSRGMDEGSIPYMVLDPGNTAVSILI
jgi:hypothetical protein